jgi:TusE/DsrC/DsvC family sulfur relay protein
MTMTLIADAPVDIDAEGFLTNPEQWNEQLAETIAAENGIPELTERHWLVVKFMRDRFLTTDTAPSIRDAIRKDRYEKIKVATVGNPGLHLPTLLGALPGFSWLATKTMQRQMEKIDMPPIPEFIELVADSGVHLYACKASVDMFGLTMDDFAPQVEDIISVGEFYEKAAGGQIIFT